MGWTQREDSATKSKMEEMAREMAVMEKLRFFSQNAENNIEKLLHGFFDFYINQFKWNDHAVSIRLGTSNISKANLEAFRTSSQAEFGQWCIEDPIDEKCNRAASCSKAAKRRIMNEMQKALKKLRKNDLQGVFENAPESSTSILSITTPSTLSVPRLIETFSENGLVKVHHPHLLQARIQKKTGKIVVFLEFDTNAGRRKAFAKVEKVLDGSCAVDTTTHAAMADALSVSTYTTSDVKSYRLHEKPENGSIPGNSINTSLPGLPQMLNPMAAPFVPIPKNGSSAVPSESDNEWDRKNKKTNNSSSWDNWKAPWSVREYRNAPGSTFEIQHTAVPVNPQLMGNERPPGLNIPPEHTASPSIGFPPGLGPEDMAIPRSSSESNTASKLQLETADGKLRDYENIVDAIFNALGDEPKLDMLPVCEAMLRSKTLPDVILKGMTKIRQMLQPKNGNSSVGSGLSNETRQSTFVDQTVITAILDSNLIGEILGHANNDSHIDLQREAIGCLGNLLNQSKNETNSRIGKALQDQGACEILARNLESAHKDIRTDTCRAVGYFAQELSSCREELFKFEVASSVQRVLSEAKEASEEKLLRAAVFAMSRLCSGKPHPPLTVMNKCFPELVHLLNHQDAKVIQNARYAVNNILENIAKGNMEEIDKITSVSTIPGILDLLKVNDTDIVEKAWRAIVHINAVGSDNLISVLKEKNMARSLCELLFAEDINKNEKITKGLQLYHDILKAGPRSIDEWNNTLLITKLEALAGTGPTDIIKASATQLLKRFVPHKAVNLPIMANVENILEPNAKIIKKDQKGDTKTVKIDGDSKSNPSRNSNSKKEKKKGDDKLEVLVKSLRAAIAGEDKNMKHSHTDLPFPISRPTFLTNRKVDMNYDPTVQPTMVEIHNAGQCKPCAFYCHKTDQCRRGADCMFCHLCGPTQLKEKRKRKKKLKRWKAEMRNRLKRYEEGRLAQETAGDIEISDHSSDDETDSEISLKKR